MTIATMEVLPFLDNWAFQRQLWNAGQRVPGAELNLVPTGRSLTVQWRNSLNQVVLAFTEFQTGTPIRIVNQARGIVEVSLTGDGWNQFRDGEVYTCEIIAYGFLYDAFAFSTALPPPGEELLNGVVFYGSPRMIREILGRVPGTEVDLNIDLSGGWSLDARGYWTKSIPKTTALNGFWVDDIHAQTVDYRVLATSGRAIARVVGQTTDTLYYLGPEDLGTAYCETAANTYVQRCIQQATAEVERKTGTFFSQKRLIRDTYRMKYESRQLFARHRPVTVNQFFRIDCYAFSRRTIIRRYTERNVTGTASTGPVLHVESPTGIITLNFDFFDWLDWGTGTLGLPGLKGVGYFPAGEHNLEFTYQAGHPVPPPDISEATALLAAIKQAVFFQQSITQGLPSLNLGCVNINFGEMFKQWFPIWQQQIDSIIGSYQRFEIEAF